MQRDANFGSVFASHSHFALFRIFFAPFSHFSHIFSHFLLLVGALTETSSKKCENGKKVQKERCECIAKEVRCNAMGLAKSASAKNLLHYHP
jgi:hypothetical protein